MRVLNALRFMKVSSKTLDMILAILSNIQDLRALTGTAIRSSND